MDRTETASGAVTRQDRAVRVLHLDDSRLDAELVRERIVADDGGAWEFLHVLGREDFEEAVLAREFDLILTDYRIPGYDGHMAVEFAHRIQPETPIIVISGTVSEEDAVAALRAGATDYVFKQRLQRLAPAARRALAEAGERRRRREAEASVKLLAQGFTQLAAKSADIFWMNSLRPERVVFVSPSVERTWELKPEVFHADPRAWVKSIHAEERGRVESAFEAWLEGRAAHFEEEYRVVRPDGSARWVHDSGTRLTDSSGAVDYVSRIARDITDSREAYRRIAESEQRFRATFEQAAVGIMFVDFGGHRERVNQRYCEIVGYSPEELLAGMTITHPDDLAETIARREEIVHGEVSTNRAVKRYIRKDGRIVWCDVTNSLVRDADDKPQYILTVIQDVTDRVAFRQRLAETEELLRLTITSMAEGVMVQDHELRILTLNPSAERIIGSSSAQVAGRLSSDPVFDIVHEDGTPFPDGERPSARALATGQPQMDVPMGFRRPDGELIWICVNATPLRLLGENRLCGVVSTFHDITQSKRAAEEIRELNASLEHKVEERTRALATETAKLRAVLDTAADAIISIDERGIILSANRATETMLGYSSDEVVGRPVNRLMPEFDAQMHDGYLRRYVQTGEAHVVGTSGREVPVRRKDGSVFAARISISEGRDGGRRFFTGILQDITELKDRERQVLRLNTDLELRAAQAEAANRELEAFSYSVSHDLRAPLHAIGGFAEALSENCADRLDPRGLHFLQRIRAGAERMEALIDDLLSLARISRAQLRASDVDLAAIASEVMAEIAEREPGRKYRFHAEPGLRAYGDARLLRVALTNMLGNAWKFSRGREETLIEVGRLSPEVTAEVFYVRDNGAGFDPAHGSRLFAAFQRLHGQAEFPGTGIGLATVRRVIERHGGRVWAEGTVGEGATFYFSLPRDPASLSLPGAAAPP